MAHAGNSFALDRRDKLVTHGESYDPASIAFQQGKRFRAFGIEFGRDMLRAIRKSLEGLTVIVPYPLAAYGGWYRGIISVDSNHESRLKDPFEAVYLLFFQALQVTSFSLAAGAGMKLTLACFRWRPWYKGGKWLGLSKEALRDVIRIYYLIIPLLLIASAWEYLFP